MRITEQLEPASVFNFFEIICGIPHGSGNTRAISDYCVSFARERGLWYRQDDTGNVIIKKPASVGYEKADAVILQGHLDMVLEQAADNTLDMTKDGLVLGIDGDDLHANGTTLGGDDGIAVAYMLALLDGSYEHPALECVFTVDEEIGLLGAKELDVSCLQGTRLINLDSEEEGIFTVGCAGGLTGILRLPVRRVPREGTLFDITLDGLMGGHSGVEIQNERGNSNKLMGRLLARLDDVLDFSLVSMEGGRLDNAIPGSTVMSVLVDPVDEKALMEQTEAYASILRHELRVSDPEVSLRAERKGRAEVQALDAKSRTLVIYLLNMLPHGVQKRSLEIADLVQTSCNLGVLRLEETEFRIHHSIRSSVKSEKEALSSQVRLCVEFLGGTYESQGEYPGWEYQKDSHLEQVMVRVYEKLYGKKPQVIAIHAGLECGIFCDQMSGLGCVSIGPDMKDIHSCKERLSISSTRRVWEFLLEVLKHLN